MASISPRLALLEEEQPNNSPIDTELELDGNDDGQSEGESEDSRSER